LHIWKKRIDHAKSDNGGEESEIDFAWFLFIGKKIGFTEKNIGHMTYYKWKRLYEHFKSMHNFETRKLLFTFKEDDNKSESKENIIFF